MDRAQADLLVAELGRQLGIERLVLDEHGSCTLAIDEGAVIVSLGHSPQAGSIDLMVCFDEVEPSGPQLARLLAANFGWLATDGAAFALEPGSGALVVQRRWPGPNAGQGSLRSALESLVAVAEAWSRELARTAPALDDDEGDLPFDPIRLSGEVLRA